MDLLSRITKEQGRMAPWRGLGATCGESVFLKPASRTMTFGAKDQIKAALISLNGRQPASFAEKMMTNFAAGGLAAIAPLLVMFPVGHAIARIQMDVGPGARSPASASFLSFFKQVRVFDVDATLVCALISPASPVPSFIPLYPPQPPRSALACGSQGSESVLLRWSRIAGHTSGRTTP